MPNENIPQEFVVNIPGVIKTFTKATSNAQAISYALNQAFQNRNSFWWSGKKYEGELGLKTLIADVLNDPGMFDYAQPLPGIPSQPLDIPLPLANPGPQNAAPSPQAPGAPAPQPMAMASKDEILDAIVRKASLKGVQEHLVPAIVIEAGRVANLTQEDRDDLTEALLRVAHGPTGRENKPKQPDIQTIASRYKWKGAIKAAFHKSAEGTQRWLSVKADSTGAETPIVAITRIDSRGPEGDYWYTVEGQEEGYLRASSVDEAVAQLKAEYGVDEVKAPGRCAKCVTPTAGTHYCLDCSPEGTLFKKPEGGSPHGPLDSEGAAEDDLGDPSEKKLTDTFDHWLDTFLSEKGLDLEGEFEFELDGQTHVMPYAVVIEAMHGCPASEKKGIKNMLVKIDFANGDVLDYLRHLGKGLAINQGHGGDMESEGKKGKGGPLPYYCDGCGKESADPFFCDNCGVSIDKPYDGEKRSKAADAPNGDIDDLQTGPEYAQMQQRFVDHGGLNSGKLCEFCGKPTDGEATCSRHEPRGNGCKWPAFCEGCETGSCQEMASEGAGRQGKCSGCQKGSDADEMALCEDCNNRFCHDCLVAPKTANDPVLCKACAELDKGAAPDTIQCTPDCAGCSCHIRPPCGHCTEGHGMEAEQVLEPHKTEEAKQADGEINYRQIAQDFVEYANGREMARNISEDRDGSDLQSLIEEFLFDTVSQNPDEYPGIHIAESTEPGTWGENNVTEVAEQVASLINLPPNGELSVSADLVKVGPDACPQCGEATEQVDNVRDLGADNIVQSCPKCGWTSGPEMSPETDCIRLARRPCERLQDLP